MPLTQSTSPLITQMDDIQRRVEHIRRKRAHEVQVKENERRDKILTYKAEAYLTFESVDFVKEITNDTDIYNYIYVKLYQHGIILEKPSFECMFDPTHECKNTGNVMIKYRESTKPTIHVNAIDFHQHKYYETLTETQDGCLIIHLFDMIKQVTNTSEYIHQENIRKEQAAEEERLMREKNAEEEHLLNEKKAEEERIYRQGVIDDTNKNIRKILKASSSTANTFTDLTLAEWDNRNNKQFLAFSSEHSWKHYLFDTNNKTMLPWTSQTWCKKVSEAFTSYYEEGKVPFCSKCPTCKAPTNFNYIYYGGGAGTEGRWKQKTGDFKEVYCNDHYLYNTRNSKHYVKGNGGEAITITYPYQHTGGFQEVDWKPTGLWREWDPSDPDGEKAEIMRKKQEAEEIQKKISDHQAKLTSLQ